MPGHPIEGKTRTDVEMLAKLFHEHDAVFLLTDSREARWLPTLLGAVSGKVNGGPIVLMFDFCNGLSLVTDCDQLCPWF